MFLEYSWTILMRLCYVYLQILLMNKMHDNHAIHMNFHAIGMCYQYDYAMNMILRLCKYFHVIWNPFHAIHCWQPCIVWDPYLWYYKLWTLLLWSSQSCVSFSFHRVLGVLVPENYSCVPRSMSCFTISKLKLWFHRLQSVMWLRKTSWS